MIFNDIIYHISKNNQVSGTSSFKIEVTRVFHSIRNNNGQNLFDSQNLSAAFSQDVSGFLESLHPMVSSRMIKDFLDKKENKDSFEDEIRSMPTFEKYLRKLKYKKSTEIQFLAQ